MLSPIVWHFNAWSPVSVTIWGLEPEDLLDGVSLETDLESLNTVAISSLLPVSYMPLKT